MKTCGDVGVILHGFYETNSRKKTKLWWYMTKNFSSLV